MGKQYPEHPCERCASPTRNSRFCSNPCRIQGTILERAASKRRPRLPCPQCGQPIKHLKAKTCSRACSDAARRTPPAPCLRCGTTERTNSGPYCSWECWNEDRYTRTGSFARWMADWTSGVESGTRADGKPDHRVRQALVLLRGQRCEQCGWDKVNPVSGRVPLHVDHITGDRSRNRPEELRLLCPNCHSLTPNYQHLNNPKVNPTRSTPNRRYTETWLSSTRA